MSNNPKSLVGVIGSGFSGLAAAAVVGAAGKQVIVFEKNDMVGGRARHFESNGFLFDMGPSWYWMPDVFEKFYNLFDHTASDFYDLKKLDPGFRVIFDKAEAIDIPADFEALCSLFESIETGSADKLRMFITNAEYKYHVGINDLVYKPGNSIMEFLQFRLVRDAFKLQLFTSFSSYVRKYFKDPRLISILEFPVLFLGARPKDTPALYSLMNYAELKQGTFYPMGGFGKVVNAFRTIAENAGVEINTSQNVESLRIKSGTVNWIIANGTGYNIDAVIASGDYHHVESSLLNPKYRSYSNKYWEEKTFAPSCLIFYLGVNKKLHHLSHHNLFFDEDMDAHADEIYINKKWPEKPLFYVCCPSKTDPAVAPPGMENLFILMPIAIGLEDKDETRAYYFDLIMNRLSAYVKEDVKSHIIYKKSYSVSDFKTDYNAFKGNAYGLANTLFQTAVFKPKIKSKKVKNLFYAGQLTAPGPGVPPSIISGQVAASQLLKYLKS